MIVFGEIGAWIVSHLPTIIKKRFFNAEKWIRKDFHLSDIKIKSAYKKGSKYIRTANYPANKVRIRARWDNRSIDDVKLSRVFLKTYVNGAPMRVIKWNEKEINLIIPREGKEIDIYNGRDFNILPKGKEGFLDIFVNIPPYIDIDENIYINILGYVTLHSSFGYFDKELASSNLVVKPEKWE